MADKKEQSFKEAYQEYLKEAGIKKSTLTYVQWKQRKQKGQPTESYGGIEKEAKSAKGSLGRQLRRALE